MMERRAEVAVVGGGPAGSASAAFLAEAGHDVLLLDRDPFPREKACAEYFSPGAVDVLRDMGVMDGISAEGAARPLGMRVYGRHGAALLSHEHACDENGQPRAALGLPRSVFDRLLLEHAARRGARVEQGVTVTGVKMDQGRVTGVAARRGGESLMVRARLVIGADGLRSIVARSLGLDRVGGGPPRIGLVARYEDVEGVGRYGGMYVGHGFYCGLAAVGTGLVNVGLVVPGWMRERGEPTEQFFLRCIGMLPGVSRALAGARRVTPVRGVGPMSARRARLSGPGYMLVGDAAGFLDPFTGEGVFRALHGARLAAGVATHELSTGVDAPADMYQRVRGDAFRDKELVCRIVQFIVRSPARLDYVLRRLDRRPELARTLAEVIGDYSPAATALRPGFLWGLLKP